MEPQADFIFHLDSPREQPARGRTALRGWISAHQEITNIRLSARGERTLALEERPDVRKAFSNYPFAQGFHDQVEPADFREGALHFVFAAGGKSTEVAKALPSQPPTPSGLAGLWVKFRRFIALQRLRFASDDPASRWNAALSALLLDIELARGTSFGREEADRLIALVADIFPEAFVVQIGANDGMAGDPLFTAFSKTRWSGLLVEPVPHLYERLVVRYRDRPGVRLERAAVSGQDGEAPLYRLRAVPGKTPEWFDQLATLNRDVLLKHRSSIPNLESLLLEDRVPTVRLETLFTRHNVTRIDLVVIDTEGHDYEILRALDFSRFHPAVLMFEHQHLSAAHKAAAAALLESHGYRCHETPEGDTIAWRKL
jgi:FkbM family methyltransferase